MVRSFLAGARGGANAVAAGIYASIGDKDTAFPILQRAYENHSILLLNLKYSRCRA